MSESICTCSRRSPSWKSQVSHNSGRSSSFSTTGDFPHCHSSCQLLFFPSQSRSHQCPPHSRDLKSSNVLLWSLDPDALCHCKVTDFGLATTQSPVGALGVEGTKRFIVQRCYIQDAAALCTHTKQTYFLLQCFFIK